MELDWLPPNCRYELDDSKGDICHYNLIGLSDKDGERIFKHFFPDNIFKCNNGEPIKITYEEIGKEISDGLIKC